MALVHSAISFGKSRLEIPCCPLEIREPLALIVVLAMADGRSGRGGSRDVIAASTDIRRGSFLGRLPAGRPFGKPFGGLFAGFLAGFLVVVVGRAEGPAPSEGRRDSWTE